MKVSILPAIVISATVTTLILVVFNQIVKGEPRLLNAAIMGCTISIVNVAALKWMMKRKSSETSNTSDSD